MLTIQDVLELDTLKGAKAITAKQKLSNQPVEWVSIMDIPVENYIRKNEFVLNTGAGSGKDMTVYHQFVESVYESGASALGIAKGKYITEIPASVLQFAEEREFPIIEIPWEKRFAEISHSIMTEINRGKYSEGKMVENIQQTLLNMILSNQHLSRMADYISGKFGQPLIVVDKAGLIKGKSMNAGGLIEKWTQYTSHNDGTSKIVLLNSRQPLPMKVERMNLFNSTILQIPIQSVNRVQGFLTIGLTAGTQAESFLTSQNMRILEHASTVLAMWFLRESTIEDTKMKLRGDFVWSLAKGDFSSWDQKVSQAKSLGYNLELPYTCLIGTPENLQELFEKNKTDSPYERWKESMLLYIQDEISLAANIVRQKVMSTNHRNDMIIFLESSFNGKNDNVQTFLDVINRRLTTLLPGVIFSWGIGRCHESEERFSMSFKDAQEALRIGRKKKGPGCCIHFDDTGMERALSRIAQDQEMSIIVNNTIKSLLEYDKQKNANLLETVMVYNANQGKTSQTARDLHLHRHTLLYRLKKIEQITNLSLFDPEDRFLLELSIKLWKLGEEASH
ncbi:PucR family transcriptional regulator [Neobacillus jeddahensis]|uniref:PucR family transcriptional regulator n=1 Tax=Neobacillus jeddahensis TaxID=1461580 RepID=UPI00058DB98B|nr:PucR family transcriptional regulator [Neobacillus jeddahensis]